MQDFKLELLDTLEYDPFQDSWSGSYIVYLSSSCFDVLQSSSSAVIAVLASATAWWLHGPKACGRGMQQT